jgi:hypothetical protein
LWQILWLAGWPEEYMHLTNSFFCSASLSFLGEVGRKKKESSLSNSNLYVRNILAGSHTKHSWRCSEQQQEQAALLTHKKEEAAEEEEDIAQQGEFMQPIPKL